ncbi:MAG: leucyl aminopeptidase family protein [Patescibacteria group bacterium]|nr:leucyl aminopeptidase family protein [Patescibacteria group bacterium]
MQITISPRPVNSKDVTVVTLVAGTENFLQVRPGNRKVLSIGIGEREKMTRRKLVDVCRQVIALAKTHHGKKLSVSAADFVFPHLGIPEGELAEMLAVNFEMANFSFVKYKRRPAEGWDFVQSVTVVGRVSPEGKRGLKRGQVIGRAVNDCRTLANTPGGEITPSGLADAAVQAVRGSRVKVTVLKPADLRTLKMGGILGVSKGSTEEPRFVIMEYLAGGDSKPIVLVGKGVTFDSGGLNLKSEQGMADMHMDMSGAAAVINAVAVAARLKLAVNVIGIIPAVENMPSGSSYHPGDILRAMSGETIEVVSTDAEGRIIMADALTYARRYHPRLVVDVATLTGAVMVALGNRAAGIFSKDDALLKQFQELGELSGDYVWPLPLWEEYEGEIKGTLGDIANIGKTRYGGAIHGALFLQHFAKGMRSIHVDIGSRMTAVDGEHLAKGAAGAPVRLLVKLLERYR